MEKEKKPAPEKRRELDKHLAKIADTYRKAGENDRLLHAEIGISACELLATRKTITTPELIRRFERLIEQSRSAKGEIDAALDLERVLWEGVIKRLSSLPSP